MIAATASHPKWRGCPFLNTGTEFPEPDHPARAVILAHKRAVRERLRALAATARARDPDLLAEQLQLLIDGAYSIGQSLGPDGPAKTVASAGRAVIAKAIAGPSTNGGALMPTIRLADGLSLHCAVDDYLWPWEAPTPVRVVPAVARLPPRSRPCEPGVAGMGHRRDGQDAPGCSRRST